MAALAISDYTGRDICANMDRDSAGASASHGQQVNRPQHYQEANMQELVDSLVRFSTAMSLFGVQQIQNVVEVATDSNAAMKKVQQSLDAVTSVVLNQLDPGKRPTVDSITNLVDKTYSTLNVPALDPRKMAQTATDAVRKAADTMTEAMTKATDGKGSEAPERAASVLS